MRFIKAQSKRRHSCVRLKLLLYEHEIQLCSNDFTYASINHLLQTEF